MNFKQQLIATALSGLFFTSSFTAYANTDYNDKIHFLPTGSGDAILIESNGKFALVDGAEDSDNPRGFESLKNDGYEKVVVDYIKRVAGDENGNVTLEFIVGTHAHSDHLGGLDTVVNDPQIKVKKAYLKAYDESKIKDNEVNNWDNKEVYEQLMNALKKEGATIVQNIPTDSFRFGDLTIQFFNTEYNTSSKKTGENENSLGILVSRDNQKVFLAGDMNNLDGDEDRVANQIGKINLLKLGHHGYTNSTTPNFVNKIKPEYAVVTNWDTSVNNGVNNNLNAVNTKVYSTMENNGVIATFGKSDFGLSEFKQARKWTAQNGYWYYKNNTNDCVKGWMKLNWGDVSSWYYFNDKGEMQTGWIKDDGKWYYCDSSGAMVTGWQELTFQGKTNWYFFDEYGAMKTGWYSKGGDDIWYYLNEQTDYRGFEGAMLVGWQQINYNGELGWYYFNEKGVMQSGWILSNGKWYYLNEQTNEKGYFGEMLTGWQELNFNGDTNWYYFDEESGAMQTGWLQWNGDWYYLNDAHNDKGWKGAMLVGRHYLEWEGKWKYYTFNSSGKLI